MAVNKSEKKGDFKLKFSEMYFQKSYFSSFQF